LSPALAPISPRRAAARLARDQQQTRQQHGRARDLVGLRRGIDEAIDEGVVARERAWSPRAAAFIRPVRRIVRGQRRVLADSTSACKAPHSRSASASAAGSPGQFPAPCAQAVSSSSNSDSSRHMRAVKGEPSLSHERAWDSKWSCMVSPASELPPPLQLGFTGATIPVSTSEDE
jgi:hypothetical protein